MRQDEKRSCGILGQRGVVSMSTFAEFLRNPPMRTPEEDQVRDQAAFHNRAFDMAERVKEGERTQTSPRYMDAASYEDESLGQRGFVSRATWLAAQQSRNSFAADQSRWPHWRNPPMSEQTEIPDWARARVREIERMVGSGNPWKAFARYIAQHEEPPLDPLLIEAREIAAQWHDRYRSPTIAEGLRAGEEDDNICCEIALAGLRRGIEIGREG